MRVALSRIWALIRKELLQTLRDKLAFVFMLIMPLAFTVFFGLIFGGADRLPLMVVDEGGGAAAKQLIATLERSKVVSVELVDVARAERAVGEKEVAAALLIPRAYNGLADAPLTVIATAGSSGAEGVLGEVRAVAAQQAATARAVRAALSTAPTPRAESARRAQRADRGDPPPQEVAGAVVRAELADPVAGAEVVRAGAAAGQTPSGFVLSSPGMLINFILFSLTTAGILLIVERKIGTLNRLSTTGLRRWELIAGKAVGMFLLTFVQQIMLLGVAQLFFGVDYLRNPGALLLMMVTLSSFASSLGLLIAVLLKGEQALVTTCVTVSMGLAALSGAWFPLEITGPTFRAIGHLLPTAWILDGLRGIVMRGFGVVEVLPALGVGMGWAAVLFALAVWRFRLSD